MPRGQPSLKPFPAEPMVTSQDGEQSPHGRPRLSLWLVGAVSALVRCSHRQRHGSAPGSVALPLRTVTFHHVGARRWVLYGWWSPLFSCCQGIGNRERDGVVERSFILNATVAGPGPAAGSPPSVLGCSVSPEGPSSCLGLVLPLLESLQVTLGSEFSEALVGFAPLCLVEFCSLWWGELLLSGRRWCPVAAGAE